MLFGHSSVTPPWAALYAIRGVAPLNPFERICSFSHGHTGSVTKQAKVETVYNTEMHSLFVRVQFTVHLFLREKQEVRDFHEQLHLIKEAIGSFFEANLNLFQH